MKRVKISYGVGYGRHYDELEFENDVPEEDIEEQCRLLVLEKLDWGFEIIEENDE